MNKCISILITITLIIGAVAFTGCSEKIDGNSDAIQRVRSEDMLAEADRQTGMPNIKNFKQKRL